MKRNSCITLRGLAAPLTFAAFILIQALGVWAFDALAALLLEIWGVTAKTLLYAPAWLQTALASYFSLRSLVCGALGYGGVLLCARYLYKDRLHVQWRHIALGAGIGICLSALAFAILMPTGSVRTMKAHGVFPLAELFSFAGAAFSALSAESLLGGVLYRASRLRRPWLKRLVFVLLGALLYGLSASWSFLSILSVFAMSALCASLYEKRSFWASAAVRCFWAFGTHRIFGFSANGTPGIFFETYPVSRDWLTGGDFGLESGLLCAVLFAAAAFIVQNLIQIPASEEKSAL